MIGTPQSFCYPEDSMRLRAAIFLSILALPICTLQAQLVTVAPGLSIPSGNVPWALDRYEGKLQLVPIHHSTVEVNNHKGANVAGSLAGSFFYKPKMTTELPGLHARTILHEPKPVFYVHINEDPGGGWDEGPGNTPTWVVVRASLTKDHRVFAKIQFTQLTGNSKRAEGIVEGTTESLPGGWLKLTPKAALKPGEYAAMPIFKVQNTFSTVVYDFTLDPAGSNVSDAIVASETP
jgi:hypothetical protein